MYNPSAPLFWFKAIFALELMLAEGLITYTLKKRSYFALRVILAIVALLACSFAIPVVSYTAVYSSVMFLVLFLLSVGLLKFCYNESTLKILFCGVLAYSCQHISYIISSFIERIANLGTFAVYSEEMTAELNPFCFIVYFATHAIVYWLVWAFVCNRIRRSRELQLKNLLLLAFSSIILLGSIILNAVVVYDVPETVSQLILTVFFFYDLFCCLLALGIQYFMLRADILQNEVSFVRNLWQKDKLLYEIKKEKANLINIKCHDMKHRLREYGQKWQMDEKSIKQLEETIENYDSIVDTGNDALNVILSEEGLFCRQRGIQLNCDIDGKQLSFMAEGDLYALFENALHNAIEAADEVEDEEKKLIKIKVKRFYDLVTIHMENYFSDKIVLEFKNGLPVTHKENKDEHGFGMQSMQLIAENYGGGIKVSAAGDLFKLDIVLPYTEGDFSEVNN